MSGSVTALQRCPGDRLPMVPLDEARFDSDGLLDDEHRAPDSIRQVLLQDQEVLHELDLRPGEVKENVTVSGVRVNGLAPGTRLALGGLILELTKVCAPCSRMEEIRPGLQERLENLRGMYAKVVQPGSVRVGDTVTVEVGASEGARS